MSRIISEGLVTGLIGDGWRWRAEIRDAQRTSHDPRGLAGARPSIYFFSLTVERDDLRDTISDTSQCAVSANH